MIHTQTKAKNKRNNREKKRVKRETCDIEYSQTLCSVVSRTKEINEKNTENITTGNTALITTTTKKKTFFFNKISEYFK